MSVLDSHYFVIEECVQKPELSILQFQQENKQSRIRNNKKSGKKADKALQAHRTVEISLPTKKL